ncbi:hypothetical protein C7B62_15145 [Pleurocapsa sp. CCALA 161]|uniref:hypothetical protein n=1 Tax=Pleurocapsa sp. CCALA 161 TaxID=2107688 RepID=UPI000D04D60F|nr:hypothetical protein [Pleurocapsa sp. CCALA 161]PSB08905.1 hypothetical protein C7B62_15145 [Pleurocapsa sp. CCALA 161]
MNRISAVASSLRKINFKQIFTYIAFTAILFLATLFNNDYASAAANQSKTTYPTDDNNVNGLLYSDSDRVESLNNVDDVVSPEEQSQLLDPTQIPAKKQPSINRADPNANLLEKTKQMFDDAANFSGN